MGGILRKKLDEKQSALIKPKMEARTVEPALNCLEQGGPREDATLEAMLRTRTVGRPPVHPSLLLLGSMLSLQLGAAWGKELFGTLGVGGTVLMRLGIGGLILLAWWRPNIRTLSARDWRAVSGLGVALALMTFCFYSSVQYLPLGVAVALEFTGPLTLALLGSRRALDVVWALLAGVGVLLLSPLLGASIPLPGLLWVSGAAIMWVAYILMSARVGQRFEGGQGLALSLNLAALFLIPVALLQMGSTTGAALLEPKIWTGGILMALLSSVIPFSLEMEALRLLPTRVFSVLLSLEPALAALVGLVVLHERLSAVQTGAIALVVGASIGSSWLHSRER